MHVSTVAIVCVSIAVRLCSAMLCVHAYHSANSPQPLAFNNIPVVRFTWGGKICGTVISQSVDYEEYMS